MWSSVVVNAGDCVGSNHLGVPLDVGYVPFGSSGGDLGQGSSTQEDRADFRAESRLGCIRLQLGQDLPELLRETTGRPHGG